MLYLLSLVLAITAQASVVNNDPCACTGDNSSIPRKQKKFHGTDYGISCRDWDMDHRYCKNPKSLQEANRACWCPKKWCYVRKECETAKLSAFFKDANPPLFYSYDACGNNADICFAEDRMPDDDTKEFEEALEEENTEESEDTLQDVIDAVVILTIKVNQISKVINSLSQQVRTLNIEVVEIAPDAADSIIAPEKDPVLIPTENIFQSDTISYAESWWGETNCPVGYKMIKGVDKCDEAGSALGYNKIENMGDGQGDREKLCTFYNDADKPGHRMAINAGDENTKLICKKERK